MPVNSHQLARAHPGDLNGLRLSRKPALSLAGGFAHLFELLLFGFGEVKIRLLQLLKPLAALFVVSLSCQAGAP